jgi:hypothetical protein
VLTSVQETARPAVEKRQRIGIRDSQTFAEALINSQPVSDRPHCYAPLSPSHRRLTRGWGSRLALRIEVLGLRHN